jgi:acetyl-CoA carboxylase biotin carboxyl carrier protein
MDLQEVLKLLELMEKHGLDEIEVEQGGVRVRLKKGGPAPVTAPILAAPVPVMAPAAAPAAPAPEKPADKDQDLVKITSPMVGTFYRAPSPDADPFVNEGDHVAHDQVVCIIEAMKVMNEIKSEVEGEVVGILVENGESVEFGQPMITVRRSK